ncbi:hypothetical protein MUK42_13543 [Musa troglodytarum]|uniref:Uncharacterized protein n=1 Tax=Musa troglodytarum TaxID=320322 RepID=A0A9E7H422_9LILI|nr:hypothetical protein MUK42_13543 [Musa troglodytarum]
MVQNWSFSICLDILMMCLMENIMSHSSSPLLLSNIMIPTSALQELTNPRNKGCRIVPKEAEPVESNCTLSTVSIPLKLTIQLFCPGWPLPPVSCTSDINSFPEMRVLSHLGPGYSNEFTTGNE